MHKLLHRTYRGYVTHPNVALAMFLEHGCEKVPNDVMRRQLDQAKVPLDRFGWASVQLDGGIEKALEKIEAWFTDRLATRAPTAAVPTDLRALNVALVSAGPMSDHAAAAFATVAIAVLHDGGSVLIPESDPLLANKTFREGVLESIPPHATLAYGQPFTESGLHVVATESNHWVENVTGLGGCGAHLVLGLVHDTAEQGHPMLPVIQVAEASQRGRVPADDVDFFLSDAAVDAPALLQLLAAVAQRQTIPTAAVQGFVDFQLTRGLLGVTT
jgi:altronate dehydratase